MAGLGGIAGAVGGILGAVAGAQGDKTNSSQTTTVNLQDFDSLNRGRSGLEQLGYDTQNSQFQDLIKLLQFGPGQNEVQANTQFQNDFASNLQNLLNQTINPSASDISKNYQQAQNLFAPQQTALNQQFQDMSTSSDQLAARLGRAGNDPILRNKLLTEQSRQQSSLNSQIGSYAQQLPTINAQNYLNIGGQLSNLRSGLATQALQNRQTLLSMGNQLAQSERNYRLQAAGRTTSGTTTSGGGLGGAIAGGLAGAGSFMNAFGSFSSPSGGGGTGSVGGGGGQSPSPFLG